MLTSDKIIAIFCLVDDLFLKRDRPPGGRQGEGQRQRGRHNGHCIGALFRGTFRQRQADDEDDRDGAADARQEPFLPQAPPFGTVAVQPVLPDGPQLENNGRCQ